MDLFANNFLNDFFGFLTRFFYEFFGSYGIAIIALTVLIRGILIPLNVRSQRSMMKQQTLASKQAEIKRLYPDDKQKQNEEIQKMMQENGALSMGGCLLPFVQLFLIWPIFYVVKAPLHYISQISRENLASLANFLFSKGAITEQAVKMIGNDDIPVLRAFQQQAALLPEAVNQGLIKMGQVIDMNFLGIDLSMQPQWQPSYLFGAEWQTYLPLLILPVLVLMTTLLQMRLTTLMKPNRLADKEAKERARTNPARKDQVPENNMENTMKIMTWTMPVIMLITTFGMPSAMALYWLIGNLMAIVQQFVIYIMFTRPMEHKKAEMELLKAQAFGKSAPSDPAVKESGLGSKKTKR
jgi:YidC/Oxa1 family membrane protein insertase